MKNRKKIVLIGVAVLAVALLAWMLCRRKANAEAENTLQSEATKVSGGTNVLDVFLKKNPTVFEAPTYNTFSQRATPGYRYN